MPAPPAVRSSRVRPVAALAGERGAVSEGRPIKRHGITSCDACGRDFDTRSTDWECPYCGFDNAVAMRERCAKAQRAATKASAEKRRRT